jgi:hypothetical protein
VRISFHTDCYKLLLKHVPVTTPAYAALINAIKVEGENKASDQYGFECSDLDADIYLATAEEFFPECINEVENAVSQAVS